MMSPHTFRPGVLSTADAEALNRLLRAGRGLTDIQVRPPLSIIRGAFDSQPIIFLVPEVTPESGSGSGDTSGSGSGTTRPTLTVVTDICLSPGGDGGFIRKAIIDPVTGEILDEFCEPIPACGSGEDGGLCDDLPPPSGSGSGSGSGEGPTVQTPCCPGVDVPETLTMTVTGSCSGSYTLTYAGLFTWVFNGAFGTCPAGANFEFYCNELSGDTWEIATFDRAYVFSPDSVSCDPFEVVFSMPALNNGIDDCGCTGTLTITITA